MKSRSRSLSACRSLRGGVLKIRWDVSYDFQAEDIIYTGEVSANYDMSDPIAVYQGCGLRWRRTRRRRGSILCASPHAIPLKRAVRIRLLRDGREARSMASNASTSSRTAPSEKISGEEVIMRRYTATSGNM